VTFTRLAAESLDQFLPTPITDSILRPVGDEKGRYVLEFLFLSSSLSTGNLDTVGYMA